jgi:hypothetical protein
MPDSIADTAVVLSLLREALTLLDAPEHARIAAHLRRAIDELSREQLREASPSPSVEDPGERAEAQPFVRLLQQDVGETLTNERCSGLHHTPAP